MEFVTIWACFTNIELNVTPVVLTSPWQINMTNNMSVTLPWFCWCYYGNGHVIGIFICHDFAELPVYYALVLHLTGLCKTDSICHVIE